MKEKFIFNLSTRIEFGEGKLNSIGEYVCEFNAKDVLIITDPGLLETDMIARMLILLEEQGIKTHIYSEVRPNPRDVDVQMAYDSLKDRNFDVVVACGGGSSMDFAKAMASMYTNGGQISRLINPNKLENDPLPVICVPTTAGTGSEVTSFAVLTLVEEQRKSSIFDDKVRPNIAVNDPQLLQSVPPAIGAATGMDALTHAIEAYTCTISNVISDGMALHAIRLIAENIHDFVHNRTSESCRGMMAGSLMAGIAFGFSDIAGVHCMAEALGGVYDTPHGVANSIFLPHVFEYNIEADVKRHRDVAIALGIDGHGKSDIEIAREGAKWIKEMSEKLNIPKLSELDNVEPDAFESLSEKCMKNVSVGSNIRKMTKEDFLLLYMKAYEMK